MQFPINLPSFESLLFARDLQNNTHLVKLKPEGSNGRLPQPKKKKQRKSGVSPEEAFEREYFSKSKQKPSHGVSQCQNKTSKHIKGRFEEACPLLTLFC